MSNLFTNTKTNITLSKTDWLDILKSDDIWTTSSAESKFQAMVMLKELQAV